MGTNRINGVIAIMLPESKLPPDGTPR